MIEYPIKKATLFSVAFINLKVTSKYPDAIS